MLEKIKKEKYIQKTHKRNAEYGEDRKKGKREATDTRREKGYRNKKIIMQKGGNEKEAFSKKEKEPLDIRIGNKVWSAK